MLISGITTFNGIEASVSGINGGRVVQVVAAGNIANVHSQDYQAARVDLSSVATGGVSASVSISDDPPLEFYNPDGSKTTFSNVDLVTEITSMKMGELMVNANAAAYKIQADSIGTILDTFG